MALAADLSARIGWLDPAVPGRLAALLARAGLPCRLPAGLGVEQVLDLMRLDKKVRSGQVRLVLLRDVGQGVVTDEFDQAALRGTLEECREAA